MFPNVALLEIFDFYLGTSSIHTWQTLVHVCQKWRNVIFNSPRRLNLRIYCKAGKPVKKTLDVWPPLPIKMYYDGIRNSVGDMELGGDMEDIIAALKYNDRVREIQLSDTSNSEMEDILAAMQEPFPALKSLMLKPTNEGLPVFRVPCSFLGGSAPCLQTLSLEGIPVPFLGLRKVLLSATDLNGLYLSNIPHSVYFSPGAIVSCLSSLTKLEIFELTFQSPRSRPDRESRRPPPSTCILLPALTRLTFQGVSEYLEDIVAQIFAPKLETLSITFFHQLMFDTPQLAQFISRTPRLKGHDEARVVFTERTVRVTYTLPSRILIGESEGEIKLGISCKKADLQLLSIAQVCALSYPQALIPTVKHLYILEGRYSSRPRWRNNIQTNQWLRLLRPFIAVRNLYLSEKIVPLIAPALRELVGGRVTEMLPVLQCLFLEELQASGLVWETISPFLSARRISTHPIDASHWDRDDDEWWDGED